MLACEEGACAIQCAKLSQSSGQGVNNAELKMPLHRVLRAGSWPGQEANEFRDTEASLWGRGDSRMSSRNPERRGCGATSRVSPGPDVSPDPTLGRSLESSDPLVLYLQGCVHPYFSRLMRGLVGPQLYRETPAVMSRHLRSIRTVPGATETS